MIDFYRQMLRIRRAEEKLMEVFSAGEILGFLHVSIGQEAAPVGVCAHLRDDDYIGRPHGATATPSRRGSSSSAPWPSCSAAKNGYCMGRSGSMHLADLSKGIMGANGIVGGGIPSWPAQALRQVQRHGPGCRGTFGRRRHQPGQRSTRPQVSPRS